MGEHQDFHLLNLLNNKQIESKIEEVGVATGEPKDKKDSSKKSGQKRNITIVYVEPEEYSETDIISSKERSETEQAGIEKVIEYEGKRGRFPEIMPHNFPGYDILSKDEKGNVVRYIEVKALSDNWGERGGIP